MATRFTDPTEQIVVLLVIPQLSQSSIVILSQVMKLEEQSTIKPV